MHVLCTHNTRNSRVRRFVSNLDYGKTSVLPGQCGRRNDLLKAYAVLRGSGSPVQDRALQLEGKRTAEVVPRHQPYPQPAIWRSKGDLPGTADHDLEPLSVLLGQ